MEPKVRIEQDGAARFQGHGRWRFRWKIENLAADALRILSARLPHGKFRSGEKSFAPPLDVFPRERAMLELEAGCAEPPCTEIENAFIILRAGHAGADWLILARLRIKIDAQGAPKSVTELITVQPVGFSERQTG
jgi:hypothetical protein